MSSQETDRSTSWKHPDELLKLQRFKQKKKQLAARLSQNNNNLNSLDIKAEIDKESLLEAKIAQKRKNPFVKQSSNDTNKKPRTDSNITSPEQDDTLFNLINKTPTTFVRETPTRPSPAKLVLQPFNPKEFAKLLHQATAAARQSEEESALEELKFSKHLPMDWCLKTRARFFCGTELPATTLKTNQAASGLTSFVRCIDNLNTESGLDISPATRFNQATYYWQHPHLPWLKLFPRNSKENAGLTLGEREREALAEDWDYSFRGLFQLLRARQCPYFYLCANTFTVLFRAAGTAGREEIHALMTPSTRGMRSTLKQEGIEFTMPLKKSDGALNKSGEGSNNANDRNAQNFESNAKDEPKDLATGDVNDDSDDEAEEEWLEKLGVDEKEIKRIKSTHSRKVHALETADDFSESSLIFIEGVECQGFFSFLLNAKSTISNVGRLAGVPPTLLAPVAFPKATMQHLTARSNKVRMDGQDYFSVEVKGIIMPTFLPYTCNLLSESKDKFSATLASNLSTLAFTKATQQLMEKGPELSSSMEESKQADVAAEQVFDQENLSDCGLVPCVVESICRMGSSAVGLLERVCYDKDHGYAWS